MTSQARSDPWRIAWNLLAGDILLGCALAGIALVLLITAWLPQAPDSISNPIAFSRWLSETQARWGTLYPTIKALGMFSLARSTAQSGLLGLAALCLLVRAAGRIYLAWNARTGPAPAGNLATRQTVKTLDEITASLEQEHYRILRRPEALYADRGLASLAGQLATYVGALLIIAGLALTGVSGWRADGLTLSTGQMAPINRLGQQLFSLRLDALTPSGLGQITLLKESETVGAGPLAYGSPVELAGLVLALRGSGPAIRASATLTDGQPVPLRSTASLDQVDELVLPLTRDEPDRFFAAPQADLVVRLARGSDQAQPIRAQVYKSRLGTLLFDDNLPADGLVTIDKTRLSLQTERYIVVDAIHAPGKAVALAGMALLALGLLAAAVWPFRQVWAIPGDQGLELAGDPVAVQKLQTTTSPSRLERFRQAIPSLSWKIGLAGLAAAAAGASAFNLRQGELVPAASLPLALIALWLAGCALAVWNRRLTRWAIVALALVALAVLILQPQPGLAPIV